MNKEETIQRLKNSEVLGKGGAAFPVWQKWEGCGAAEGDFKYIICNSSEGELGLFKDLYVWRNHMDKVFKGIDYAVDFLGKSEVYIHINRDYFNELQGQLYKFINDRKWKTIFHINIEENCYIGGEASALMNIIENGVAQPRLRTTRTVVKGLFEKPTLMQNVETFHDIAMILDGVYDNCRFSGIFGDGIEEKFVARHNVKASIKNILEDNKIRPTFDYFVQIGGSASGLVLNSEQLDDYTMIGAGSIEIFDKSKNNLLTFLDRLGNFYEKESCGKCMGKKFATNLNGFIKVLENEEMVISNIPNITAFVEDMNRKTFCKLCKSFKQPFDSYCKNILGITLNEEEK
jgi:NADH:ubiquinone oxidoreductase subunit F (NADH-binding)